MIEINSTRMLATELVTLVRTQGISVICIADLPPSPPSKSRYLIKRLRAAFPELRIVMGRWSPAAMADESTQALKEAGATLVATTLAETREYLEGLVEIVRVPAPDAYAGQRAAAISDRFRLKTRTQSSIVTGRFLPSAPSMSSPRC